MITSAFETDMGKGSKQINQDRIIVKKILSGDREISVLGIADGMGGQGEIASSTLVESLETVLDQDQAWELPELKTRCRSAISHANEKINTRIKKDTGHGTFGTTLTLVMIQGNTITCFHIGDCRLYLLRKDSIRQITNDHNLTGHLLRQGKISPGEALAHHGRNKLFYFIGGGKDYTAHLEETRFILHPNDYLLLSSDGFHDTVPQTVWQPHFKDETSPEKIVPELVALSREYQARDNVSLGVVRFVLL